MSPPISVLIRHYYFLCTNLKDSLHILAAYFAACGARSATAPARWRRRVHDDHAATPTPANCAWTAATGMRRLRPMRVTGISPVDAYLYAVACGMPTSTAYSLIVNINRPFRSSGVGDCRSTLRFANFVYPLL